MERRKFTREFKLEAVKLIKERGVTVAPASRDLGVHGTASRRWLCERSAWWVVLTDLLSTTLILKHSACVLLLAIRSIALPVFTAIVDVSVCWHQKGEARSTGPSAAPLALPGRSRRIEIGVFRHR
jgi:Transposase